MDAALRPYAPDDVAAVAAIYRDEVLHGVATFETEPPDIGEMKARFAALTAAGYPALVAASGTSVLGYAYANVFRTRPAFRWTVEDSVYVAAGARGRGIGRLLLDGLVAASTACGFRQMIAVIGDSGNAASIRVHAAAGFLAIGVHPAVGWKLGRWVDTVVMQRGLGAAAQAPP